MIRLESLYAFISGNFDYLLVVDGSERIVHANSTLIRDCCTTGLPTGETLLSEVLTEDSLSAFRSAMVEAKAGKRAVAVLSKKNESSKSIPLRAGYAGPDSGEIYVFFGNRVGPLAKRDEWEKEERIKELSSLYEVAEWIEVSSSVDEFFRELPRVLAPGMMYPEAVVVWARFHDREYGQRPSSEQYLSVDLKVGQKTEGEIRVGYLDDRHELLPEEQRLLDEIGRMLSLALERKELRELMSTREAEDAEHKQRLAALEEEIASRTEELEAQNAKLSVVNSYLDRVNRGWEEASSRLETTFRAIPDDVVLIDKNRKIVMTNREDLEPGVECYRGYFHRDTPCEDCRLSRIIRDKTPISLTMKRDDRFLQVHALPVYNQDQEVDGILEFYRDVTLEKTYEQQLQQADKLASLGQLVSGIGHEINNPNQFIRGNIKILKQALEDILPITDEYYAAHPDLRIARLNYEFFREHVMTLVQDMAHGSERIKGIVEGLRGFARKDEGLLVDRVDVNTLIDASARLVHNEVHKRADIELDLAEDLPTFQGNSQKIEQVLINLLVNAGQAMPDDVKGLIRVSTRYEVPGVVVIEVGDNGKGMNEKVLKQIFDPFFTTKRAKGGTGLGLAIAYRIIEEHGGTISVSSRLGEGTTFTIRIPVGAQDSGGTADEADTDSR
jgi:signal transduction histidine kinase